MGFYNKYPYSDFHELNLDWLISKMKELAIQFDEFKVVNNITFSGRWDITKQYPAWTIVNDNDIGYVSTQPVPAGITLDNTDYWVAVIDYSTQIAGLQNRVVALENTVGDSSSGLIHDLDATEADVDALEKVVYKKYGLIGDSYFDPNVSGNHTSVATQFIELMGLTENVDCAVSYAGGHGFVSDGTRTFAVLLEQLYNKVNSSVVGFSPSEMTDLIVVGGDNDAWHLKADIDAAITVFCTQAKIYFPNATIHIGEIGNVKANNTNHKNIAEHTIPAYQDSVRHGVHYLSGVETVMLRYAEMYTSDNIHPNGTGMNALAAAIKQALTSHYKYDITEGRPLSLEGNDMGSTSTSINITAYRHGETLDIMVNGNIHAPNPIPGYTTKILGTVPDKIIQGTIPNSFGVALARIGTYKLSPVILYFENSLLKMITSEDISYGSMQIVLGHFIIPSYYN